MADQCLFCRIVAGEIPATVVRESERTLAFTDINPMAPTHVLVIPREHYDDIAALVAADGDLLTEVIREAVAVAEQEGVSEGGYRLVTNSGEDSGQTVQHLHVHVLGGRFMDWPPG